MPTMRPHLPIALIAALIPGVALVAMLAFPAHADVSGTKPVIVGPITPYDQDNELIRSLFTDNGR